MISDILKILNEMTAIEGFMLGGILLYMILKGIITLPKWIKIKKGNKGDGSKIEDHSHCPKFPPLKNMVMASLEKSAEIQRIQINESINEQMNEADELFVDIREILKTNYLTLYKPFNENKISGLLQCKEVKCYLAMIDNSEKELKGMTRRFIKKNHFTEKSDLEFRTYIQERSEDYQRAVSKYLDEHYVTDDFKVSREELFESNMKNCIPEINKKIETFFYRIRDIAKAKELKIKNLKSQIKEFI